MDVAESRDIVSAITTATADDETMAVAAKEVSADAGVEAASPKSYFGDVQDAASPFTDEFTNFASLSPGPTEIDEEAVKATETTLLGLGLVSADQLKRLRILARQTALDSIPERDAQGVADVLAKIAPASGSFPWPLSARTFLSLDAHEQCEMLIAYGVGTFYDVVEVLKALTVKLRGREADEGKSATTIFENTLSAILEEYKKAEATEPRTHRYDPVYSALVPTDVDAAYDWLFTALRDIREGTAEPSGLALAKKLLNLVPELTRFWEDSLDFCPYREFTSLISGRTKEQAFLEVSGTEVSFEEAASRLRQLSKRNEVPSSTDLKAFSKFVGFPEAVTHQRLTLAPVAGFSAQNTIPGEMKLSFWVAIPVEGYKRLSDAGSLQRSFISYVSDVHILSFKSVLFNYDSVKGERTGVQDREALKQIRSGLRSFMRAAQSAREPPCVYSDAEDLGTNTH